MDFTTASRERKSSKAKEVFSVVIISFADGPMHDVAIGQNVSVAMNSVLLVRTGFYKLHNKRSLLDHRRS